MFTSLVLVHNIYCRQLKRRLTLDGIHIIHVILISSHFITIITIIHIIFILHYMYIISIFLKYLC